MAGNQRLFEQAAEMCEHDPRMRPLIVEMALVKNPDPAQAYATVREVAASPAVRTLRAALARAEFERDTATPEALKEAMERAKKSFGLQ